MIIENDVTAKTPIPLETPTIPVALDGGLIPVQHLAAPIVVNFPVWPAAEQNYTYQLVFDGQRIPPEVAIQETDKPGDLLSIEIPISLLTEGVHSVSYRAYSPFGDSEEFADPASIVIDRTAPGIPELAPIIFSTEVLDGLTSDELEAMNNVLAGRIASYNGMAVGDVIRTYWGNVEGPQVSVDANDMGLNRVMIDYPRAFLEQIGDGREDVYYTVTDLAGNLSAKSEVASIELKLSVVTPLPLPTILEAENDVLDPAKTANGATVVIAASAGLRLGDHVKVSWSGPKGSDEKEKVIDAADAGNALSVVFSSALVNANDGQQVVVSYRVTRVNGTVQDSATYTVKVSGAWSALPAPTMDSVQADGVVDPGVIPASGATVRVRYEMRADDRVKVVWAGASRHETAEQTVVSQAELLFNVPKALITASAGTQAVLSYLVTRAGAVKESELRTLTVRSALELDTSAVTLGGKVYLVPAHPDALPALPAGTTVQRVASGGTAPYTYSSSNTQVAAVDNAGLASVRGNGTASITVTDATGQSLSYEVTVTGVIVCIALGAGKWGDMSNAASGNNVRLPSIHELREIHAMWGNQWPLVKTQHWSSTLAKVSPFGKTYYIKFLGSGGELDAYTYSAIPAIGIR